MEVFDQVIHLVQSFSLRDAIDLLLNYNIYCITPSPSKFIASQRNRLSAHPCLIERLTRLLKIRRCSIQYTIYKLHLQSEKYYRLIQELIAVHGFSIIEWKFLFLQTEYTSWA